MVKKRNAGYQMMRVTAAWLVVLLHVAAYTTFGGEDAFSLSLIYNALGRVAVPIFLMVTGALLIPKKETLAKFALRFWKRVVIVILLATVLAGIYLSIKNGSLLLECFNPLCAQYYHLHYLYYMGTCYLLVPLFSSVWNRTDSDQTSKGKHVVEYITALCFATTFISKLRLLPSLGMTLSVFPWYVGYMLLGVVLSDWVLWLRQRPCVKRVRCACVLLYVSGSLLTALIVSKASMETLNEYYLNYDSPFISISAVVFFVFFSLTPNDMRSLRSLSLADDATLGIYILHPFVLDLLRDKIIRHPSLAPLFATVVFVLTGAVVVLVKRLFRRCFPSRCTLSKPTHTKTDEHYQPDDATEIKNCVNTRE